MMKEDLLNRVRTAHHEFSMSEKMSGDEADQTVALIAENSFLSNQERLRTQLLEIEFALGRIERGQFGLCEETQEPIEAERLLAIPYTRLSIEGAELRDAVQRRFAR
jgi:DnaK suppressor protein